MVFIGKTLPFVTTFVDELDSALRRIDPEAGMTRLQQGWLAFCLMAIVVTNSICWKRFQRASLGLRSHASLSWMFRQPNRFWQVVLQASVNVILNTRIDWKAHSPNLVRHSIMLPGRYRVSIIDSSAPGVSSTSECPLESEANVFAEITWANT